MLKYFFKYNFKTEGKDFLYSKIEKQRERVREKEIHLQRFKPGSNLYSSKIRSKDRE